MNETKKSGKPYVYDVRGDHDLVMVAVSACGSALEHATQEQPFGKPLTNHTAQLA